MFDTRRAQYNSLKMLSEIKTEQFTKIQYYGGKLSRRNTVFELAILVKKAQKYFTFKNELHNNELIKKYNYFYGYLDTLYLILKKISFMV